MEKELFINGGIQRPLEFNHNHAHTWQSLSSSMELQPDNFESAMSSIVSSPAASNSAVSNHNLIIGELIGKLGSICNSPGDYPHAPPSYVGGGSCSTNNSCYSTPLSSPPKMGISMPIMDHLMQENFPSLPAMPGDPGFAERAARFSSFGSRSFNGRSTQFGVNNNGEVGYRLKLQRVSSSPSLKAEDSKNSNEKHGEFSNQGGGNGSKRKRKAATHKGKSKETQSQSNSNKVGEKGEDSNSKRSKSEESKEGNDCQKQSNVNEKPPEPPKDYIHVRARRGQATDSHSLAERVRREKISERMKLLQDLVPGCNKVTGKALMLDEIINYVQSLQRQVEFLSMKLASVNPRLEFNMGNLFSKDVSQPNCSLPHPMYPNPLDSMAPNLYGQPHQNPLQESITTEGSTKASCPINLLNPTLNPNYALHIPVMDGFSNGVPQLPSLCEGDLQSIVQMGFGQKENGFQSQALHGSNPTSLMKIQF